MPKKSEKASKPAVAYTYLYELVATFSGRARRLVCHVEEKEKQRLLNALDADWEHGFYGVDLPDGLECLINTVHVTRISLLDYLPGIRFEAESKRTDKQWAKYLEEREASDEPVFLCIWLRGEAQPIVHADIEHAAWVLARTCLIERDKFIHFTDEDGEDVIYGTDQIDAIEMIDPFYLTDEQVEKALAHYREEPEPDAPAQGVPPS